MFTLKTLITLFFSQVSVSLSVLSSPREIIKSTWTQSYQTFFFKKMDIFSIFVTAGSFYSKYIVSNVTKGESLVAKIGKQIKTKFLVGSTPGYP